MGDIEHLRLGFCQLIMQAKGSLISNFVAWLDLKVAEYKVYGHMILNDDESEGSGAWQYSSPSDPTNWPRSLPDGFGDQASSGLPRMSAVPTQYSAPTMSSNSRGRKTPYGRLPARGRPRPARPKSVTNLLKNAISRTQKTGPASHRQSAIPAPKIEESIVDTSSLELAQQQMTATTQAIAQSHSQTMPAAASSGGAEHVSQTIKAEPGLQMSVEIEQQYQEMPVDEQGMWLTEPAAGPSMMDQSPSTSYSMPTTPRSAPPQQRGRGRGRGGSMSSSRMSTGATSGAMMGSPAVKRTPSRDSVNELLQTHTIQTESGFVCGICGKMLRTVSRNNMHRHIRAEHLGVKYKCPHCPQEFKWQGDVKRHMQCKH